MINLSNDMPQKQKPSPLIKRMKVVYLIILEKRLNINPNLEVLVGLIEPELS